MEAGPSTSDPDAPFDRGHGRPYHGDRFTAGCAHRLFGRDFRVKRAPFLAAGFVALAALLGGCGAAESLNPAGWFSSSETEKKGAEETQAVEPARASAPDWDALREKMADGLIADRENARHTGEPIPRQSDQLTAPPRASTEGAR